MRAMCKTVGNDLQVSPNLVSVLGCRTPQIALLQLSSVQDADDGRGQHDHRSGRRLGCVHEADATHGVSLSDLARHGLCKVMAESYGEVGYNRMTDLQAAVGLSS
ncbi:hypothetical protein [Tunturiibacter gelidiferens]|uniref:hypothetical protein n=1 Tax=Tunturiibacter gelidiferens TaxID=3069689 RepID=UPI003D9BB01D